MRTRKRRRLGHRNGVGCDRRTVEGKKSDKIEGDEGFPGGRNNKLRGRRSGVDHCCDVDIKRSETLGAWVEEAVGREDWQDKGEKSADGEDRNGVCTVNELERVELSDECEFSLEGICHSSKASVVLNVGHGGSGGSSGSYFEVNVVGRETLGVVARGFNEWQGGSGG